jgi:Holliday junction resolvasome RuvABC endonuclease subunit
MGLDLSLTATGLAIFHNGHIVTYTLSSDSKIKGDDPARWDQILNQIWPHVDGQHVLAAIEGLFPTVKGNSHDNLQALRSVLIYGLAARGAQYVTVAGPTLKKYATGSGRPGLNSKEQKAAVVAAVNRRYGHLVKVANHNEADAMVLLAMTLHHYGHSLAPVSSGCYEALLTPAWPILKEHHA